MDRKTFTKTFIGYPPGADSDYGGRGNEQVKITIEQSWDGNQEEINYYKECLSELFETEILTEDEEKEAVEKFNKHFDEELSKLNIQ